MFDPKSIPYPYGDTSLSFEERAADLVSRMTLEEKISWCSAWTAPIPRLGLPAWHFANEASHGINSLNYLNDKAYNVTSFPVCLAMAQSWDREKIKKVTRVISDEARAVHNMGDETLSFWCPTVNLSRDPRNGRSDENFGEDPFLSGKMAAAYIQGFQGAGEHEKYIKAAATPKHFMMNSSENNRNTGISFSDERTLRDYYARVFEYAVREGRAQSVMSSYNRVNGVPASASEYLLKKLLREEWGFDGYVVSDCSAVGQMYKPSSSASGHKEGLGHYYFNNIEEACAGALLAGCDISGAGEPRAHLMNAVCSSNFQFGKTADLQIENLKAAPAVKRGLITEDQIDKNVIRSLTSLFRQGLFDGKGATPWDGYGPEKLATWEHHELAADMAGDTIVLLKNDRGLLPINKNGLKKVLVVGPNARYRELGGYSCGEEFGAGGPLDPKYNVMALDGIISELEGTGAQVIYEKGWNAQKEYGGPLDGIELIPGVDPAVVMEQAYNAMGIERADNLREYNLPPFTPYKKPHDPDFMGDQEALFDRALAAARDADVVIMVAGTDSGTAAETADRDSIALPNGQGERILKMLKVNPNTVVVLAVMGTIGDPSLDACHSLVLATYAGQAQGTAIANVLFGNVNPNGKLTATWYMDDSQLPHINDYSIRKSDTFAQEHGRTYWYLDEKPRFPFGYGLHYTTFSYSNLRLDTSAMAGGGPLKAYVDVSNTGNMAGREIVQLYIRKIPDAASGELPMSSRPLRQLKGFEKVHIEPGQTITVAFHVPLKDLAGWNNFRQRMYVEMGQYAAEAGPSSADIPCTANFTIASEWDAPLSTVYAETDRHILAPGEISRVHVTATYEDTTRLPLDIIPPVFTSSNESVARVDETGRVTAIAPGTALITAAVTAKGRTVKRSLPFAVR